MRPRFFYELKGARSQTLYHEDGFFNFQNLPYGDYTLSVSTVGMDNKKSQPKIVYFEILPPWYLSTVSKFGYLLALVLLVFLISSYNRRKLERKHNILQEQFLREQTKRIALKIGRAT